MTVIFNGKALAARKTAALKTELEHFVGKIKIVTLSVITDEMSEFYSQKKKALAAELGIDYQIEHIHFDDNVQILRRRIQELNADETVTGIMLQKPHRRNYGDFFVQAKKSPTQTYDVWWHSLTEVLPLAKDVDGLSVTAAARLAAGESVSVLPATVRAILASVENFDLTDKNILVLGRSDLAGLPLTNYWRHLGYQVTNWGKKELQMQLTKSEKLKNFQVIVSATGAASLITGDMLAKEMILLDVGEPRGDFEFSSCSPQAAFITPVPGGIGPLTVISLLENAFTLAQLALV
ncbi:MAG: bifunctional 5,10-methylenetetrahydrofolate dehydrogenase/5,10-methenyltetrahydrofolate cyclohydrolase [bacterium]|nr:bifunctional 5,10-methylenetetrahydrofolate dehydrogenase/5,10-methenyltetrahydrofolate cyclohydrolase [bacterium]